MLKSPCFNLLLIVDTTPPSVTCQSAITRVIELGNSGVEVFYNEPSATDISGQVSRTSIIVEIEGLVTQSVTPF